MLVYKNIILVYKSCPIFNSTRVWRHIGRTHYEKILEKLVWRPGGPSTSGKSEVSTRRTFGCHDDMEYAFVNFYVELLIIARIKESS